MEKAADNKQQTAELGKLKPLDGEQVSRAAGKSKMFQQRATATDT